MGRLYEAEEERLFYVAMTRARYNLIICCAARRDGRASTPSQYLDRARLQDAVSETATHAGVELIYPPSKVQEPSYRSDGRVYQTNSGAFVRTKSELLLANEFTRRGMYFEYEEPVENVAYALPDFIFPDYGLVVLEHLGLLTDGEYFARWEEKAKEYEQRGIRYFRTNEQELQHLSATVERLQEQFRDWALRRHGVNRVQRIGLLERLRREGGLRIGRAIGAFDDGIFELEDSFHQDGQLAAVIGDDAIHWADSGKLGTIGQDLVWDDSTVARVHMRIGKSC